MVKRVVAIILCLALVLVFSACKPTEDTGSVSTDTSTQTEGGAEAVEEDGGEMETICYFGGGMQATWLQLILKAMTEMGSQHGYKVTNADAEWDGDKMLSQIDQLMDGIDGAAIFLVDAGLGPAVWEKFEEANKPLAFETMPVFDSDGKFGAPGVLADTDGIGRVPAEWTIEHIADLGFDPDNFANVGLMLGTNGIFSPTDDRAQEYKRVFKEAFPKFPESNIFVCDVANDPNRPDDTEGSYTMAMTIFTANPQIEQWLVYGSVDDYSVGIARAIEASGLTSKAKLMSVGGERALPEWENTPSVNEYWIAELYFNSMDYVKYVDEALMGMIRDGKTKEQVLTDYIMPDQYCGVGFIVGDMVTPNGEYDTIKYLDHPGYLPGF
jgi:ABC-type sugar transport system substrate-binding protein